MSEQTFSLDPGTTNKDTSDIQIVIVTLGDDDYEIRARRGDGSIVVLCPSRCPTAKKILNDSSSVFTLKQVDGGYEIEVTGLQFTQIICPSPCPSISKWIS